MTELSGRQEAVSLLALFRKHLDAFLDEAGEVSPIGWTMFCITLSRRFYAARENRAELNAA